MKTEKEFSEYFRLETGLDYPVHSDDDVYLDRLSQSYWMDLTSHLTFYFAEQQRSEITKKAANFFGDLVQSQPLDEAWKSVLRDFNQKNYWDFDHQIKKPKSAQTEEQKIFWKLFKYTWAFFQAMVILKIAVYYFGLESAVHPDQTNVGWVWFFFGLSFCSLVFFAYRNRHDKN